MKLIIDTTKRPELIEIIINDFFPEIEHHLTIENQRNLLGFYQISVKWYLCQDTISQSIIKVMPISKY
jgi:hypothetical protein